jgi:hypothetical protein
MRGDDQQQNHMFSYFFRQESRVRKDHPLHAIRTMVDKVLAQLSRAVRHEVRPRRPSVDCAPFWFF